MIDDHHLERGERLRQLEQRAARSRLRNLVPMARGHCSQPRRSAAVGRLAAAVEQLVANVEARA